MPGRPPDAPPPRRWTGAGDKSTDQADRHPEGTARERQAAAIAQTRIVSSRRRGAPALRNCAGCGTILDQPHSGRPRRFCSASCRQAAYRARRLPPVLAAGRWPTNAHLIADIARLGYLRHDWLTLDATHGLGVWWKRWRPDRLVTADKYTRAALRSDFRALPFPDGTFDAVVYDPPYVHAGGRATSTIPGFQTRYGLDRAPQNGADLSALMLDGVREVHRVVRTGGYLLVKVKDEISSGKYQWRTGLVLGHALACGAQLVDRFVFITRPGPQPARGRQLHARHNHSELLVFRKAVAYAQPEAAAD